MSRAASDPNAVIGRDRAGTLLVALGVVNLGYAAALVWLAYVTLSPDLLKASGQPIPDFTAFWAAGRLALDGTPALAYDWQAHRAVEVAALGHDFEGWMPWHYPPPFQLAIAPFAALPHWAAMAFWCGLTLGLYLWACWRILPDWRTLAAALAVAPTAMIFVNGQTGFLIAALLGLALLQIDRRPALSGLLLGGLSIKPHLVAAIPLVLAAAGRWRLIFAGAAAVAGLGLVSLAALGGEPWAAFMTSITGTADVFSGQAGRFSMYASAYGGLRFTGLGFDAALALHAIPALAALWLTARAWRNPSQPPALKAALLCYATLAATPRVLSYDLHILLIGALFQVRHALLAGFYRGEQLVLGVVALGAFVSLLFAPGLNPILPLALFSACWIGHLHR